MTLQKKSPGIAGRGFGVNHLELIHMGNTTVVQSGAQQLVRVFDGVIGGVPVQACDGRELHAFLQNGKQFSDWIKQRIGQYGFEVNQDFSLVSPKSEIKKGRGGDRRSVDYHLTLDMAKELSMVENNEQGRMARRYFIDMERKALNAPGLPAPAEQELLTLDYEGRRLRILRLDGMPWLVASDVALALGLRNSYVIVRRLTAGQHQKRMVGAQQLNILKMSAVRQAMLMAAPERASQFGKWLDQVLEFQQAPAAPSTQPDPGSLLRGMLAGNRFMCLLDSAGRITLREIPEDHIITPVGQIPNWIADPSGAQPELLPRLLQAVTERLVGQAGNRLPRA